MAYQSLSVFNAKSCLDIYIYIYIYDKVQRLCVCVCVCVCVHRTKGNSKYIKKVFSCEILSKRQ